jgi:hypothetical protein
MTIKILINYKIKIKNSQGFDIQKKVSIIYYKIFPNIFE